MRRMQAEIRRISAMADDELFDMAKQLQVPYDLVLYVHEHKKLPVVNFAAGGVATPADAALYDAAWRRRGICRLRHF